MSSVVVIRCWSVHRSVNPTVLEWAEGESVHRCVGPSVNNSFFFAFPSTGMSERERGLVYPCVCRCGRGRGVVMRESVLSVGRTSVRWSVCGPLGCGLVWPSLVGPLVGRVG